VIDEKFSTYLITTSIFTGMTIISASTAVIVAGWQMTIPAIVTIVFGVSIGLIYMAAQLPVKRLLSNAKSPIIGHIQNALVALGLQNSFFFKCTIIDCAFSFRQSIWGCGYLPNRTSSETGHIYFNCYSILGSEQVTW
jgi:uncharacterized membrane protein